MADFDALRDRAIVLDDSQRAYFSRNGQLLYTEDGQQITDRTTVTKALAIRSGTPTYEDFTEKRTAWAAASHNVEQLGTALERLGELDRRVNGREMSADELAAAQKETADLVNSLPAEARDEYERMRSRRRDEPAGPSAEEFQRTREAAASASIEQSKTPAPQRSPVYRPTDF
jgi:hypothetical protein